MKLLTILSLLLLASCSSHTYTKVNGQTQHTVACTSFKDDFKSCNNQSANICYGESYKVLSESTELSQSTKSRSMMQPLDQDEITYRTVRTFICK